MNNVTTAKEDIIYLNQLIDLAEKVSVTREESNSKRRKSVINILLYYGLIVMSIVLTIYYERQDIVSAKMELPIAILITVCLIYFAYNFISNFFQLRKLASEARLDEEIAKKLIYMIDERKRSIFRNRDIDRIELVIIEMRLSRIKFSSEIGLNFIERALNKYF